MADYKFSQQSGSGWKVNISDKADAYQDTNELRAIVDELGRLLGHSKKDGAFPEDGTSGGTLTAKLSVFAATTSAELAGVISDEVGTGLLMFIPTLLADKRLFGNAAGNAPEWTTGIKIGTFTRDTAAATGTQAVTGVGFKPSNIIFIGGVTASTQISIGIDDGTVHYSLVNIEGETATHWALNSTRSIAIIQAAGINYHGNIDSLDSDGFTITWTKAGEKTGTATIYYMAFR